MSSLEQFVVFKEVADLGNITQAAKHLHISQPSISIQIQNLEQEYGAELLARTNRGVTLTECGKVFYKYITHVIQTMNEARDAILDHCERQMRCVHLGATLTIGEYLVPYLLAALEPSNGDPRFNVIIANTAIIAQDILEKKLNLGLIEGPIPYDPDLVIENFWHDELVIVVPIDHPWSKRVSITFDELTTERFITREQGSGTRKVMEMALEKGGFDPSALNIHLELNSTQAIKQGVLAGMGVTIISALTVQEECRRKQASILRIDGCQLTRPLNILTRAKSFQTAEEQLFLHLLRSREKLKELLPPPLLP